MTISRQVDRALTFILCETEGTEGIHKKVKLHCWNDGLCRTQTFNIFKCKLWEQYKILKQIYQDSEQQYSDYIT